MARPTQKTKPAARRSKTDTPRPTKDLSYAQAAARLDEILETLEEGEVDIDLLSGLVKEAAELVQLCRGKIQAARVEVDTLAEQFEQEDSDDDAEDDADND